MVIQSTTVLALSILNFSSRSPAKSKSHLNLDLFHLLPTTLAKTTSITSSSSLGMPSALMKILHPTTLGFLVAPTRFTATSSTPGVFSSVLSKKRLHPTITGFLDSPTSSTLPSSAPGLNLSVLLKNCLPPTIQRFLG
ncbi:hypothetical protein QL285_082017 [Trifolium repens]|nr:hypothetical protein QL285_082017 [Trifolium repens]